MPLILYHIDTSVPGRSVILVAHALDLTLQYRNVDIWNEEQFTPEFLALNPLHTVPTLDDDGFIVWDSHAIMTYLVSKYGKDDSLYPKDFQKRAVVDERLHYSNDVFFVLRVASKKLFIDHETSVSAGDVIQIQECQENIEKLLDGHEFMAGDTLTVADYSYITLVDVAEMLSPSEDKFPETKAWIQRCHSNMKDFDKANRYGAEKLMTKFKELLSQ